MKKDSDDLLNKIVIQKTGDFETDLRNIAVTLRDNFDYIEDETFVQALDQYLTAAYADKSESLETMLTDIDQSGDAEFIDRMRQLFDQEPIRAQFETALFIRKMEDDFSNLRPKMNEKHLAIFSAIDQFKFYFDNGPEIELQPTERDYAGLYRFYAQLLFKGNDWRDSAENYQQAILWNPYDSSIYYELAHLYQEMNQFGMSYPTILSALKHSVTCEELAQGFSLLGAFYASKEDWEIAYRLYELSQDWQNTEAVNTAISDLEDQVDQAVLAAMPRAEVLKKLSLNHYPNEDMVAALADYTDNQANSELQAELQAVKTALDRCHDR